jgi:hypothetical protein
MERSPQSPAAMEKEIIHSERNINACMSNFSLTASGIAVTLGSIPQSQHPGTQFVFAG